MSITLWKPEQDVVLHQALGKLAEECAELSQAVARCLIQGYHEEEPVTHKLNRTQLMEEVADVKAAMRWLFDVLDQPFKGESQRERRKFDGFKRWQHMLEADMKTSAEPQTAVFGTEAAPHCERRHICPDVLAGIPCRGPCAPPPHTRAVGREEPSKT